jgi:hypothetical protein
MEYQLKSSVSESNLWLLLSDRLISHILPSTSKLQSATIFEPFEGINEVEGVTAFLKQFDDKNEDDESIFGFIQEGCSFGSDFVLLMLTQGIPAEINKILKCIKQIGNMIAVWPHLVSAIIQCAQGNCLVLKYDMQKYFDVLKALFAVASGDFDMVEKYTSLLHSIRPLHVPVFGLCGLNSRAIANFL